MYQEPLAALPVCVSTMIFMTDAARGGALSDGPARWERAAELFADWRSGNARAIDDLVRLMTPVLWHVVRAYGLDRPLAEDVVQTTWLALVRGHEKISDFRSISGWLTTAARREAWKVSKRERRADATDNVVLEPMLPVQESAETTVTASDEARLLWKAVAALDERCRRLLRVIAFDDRPDYATLAAELDMPVGSIGPTRGRCLVKLRARLTHTDGVDERGNDG